MVTKLGKKSTNPITANFAGVRIHRNNVVVYASVAGKILNNKGNERYTIKTNVKPFTKLYNRINNKLLLLWRKNTDIIINKTFKIFITVFKNM